MVKGPLEGIRAVECTQWIQGPMVGVMLADLGADVIKVEDPGVGDGTRGWLQTGHGAQTHKVERNYIFEACNRGKKSITLNLRTEKGREILYELVKRADVFLHNWRADSVAKRLRADYETLSKINPQLIYSHASGWGPEGPISELPAYDLGAEARSGLMHLCREPEGSPLVFPGGIGDIIGSITGVVGILAGLLARGRIGKGQKVDTSLIGSLLQVITLEICSSGIAGEEYPLRTRSRLGNPLYNNYPCGDGKWLTFCMTQPDKYWHNFCEALGVPELENDPRFTNLTVRAENAVGLIRLLDARLATKTRDEWIDQFQTSNVDLIYAPVQTIPEVLEDPQVLANDYVVDLQHPNFGTVKVPGIPHKFSETPAGSREAAPELGQHTEEILLEIGHTWEDIVGLKDGGVI